MEQEQHRLVSELKKAQGESQQLSQEQQARVDRDREQLRESLQRGAAAEKERLQEVFRERLAEVDARLRRAESERQRADIEHARALRERELQLEQAKGHSQGLQQALQQAQAELALGQAHLKEVQGKLAASVARRQAEAAEAEAVMRAQLREVEGMLARQAAEFAERHREEMSLERQEMDALRLKMTENIVYLQNEIRKRDDLLETTSEFGDDFEMIEGAPGDDTSLMEEIEAEEDFSNRGGLARRGSLQDSQREAESSSLRQSFQMIPATAPSQQ